MSNVQNGTPEAGMDGQVQIEMQDLEDVVCKTCSGVVFEGAVVLKRLSPLHPKAGGQERFFPISVLKCVRCGTILENVSLQ